MYNTPFPAEHMVQMDVQPLDDLLKLAGVSEIL